VEGKFQIRLETVNSIETHAMSEMHFVLTGNKGKIIVDYDKEKIEAEYVEGRGFRATVTMSMPEVRFSVDNTNFSIQYGRKGSHEMPLSIEHRNCGGEIEETIDNRYGEQEPIKGRVWICKKCNQQFQFDQFVDQARRVTSMKT
jgi:hypothetical protein